MNQDIFKDIQGVIISDSWGNYNRFIPSDTIKVNPSNVIVTRISTAFAPTGETKEVTKTYSYRKWYTLWLKVYTYEQTYDHDVYATHKVLIARLVDGTTKVYSLGVEIPKEIQ